MSGIIGSAIAAVATALSSPSGPPTAQTWGSMIGLTVGALEGLVLGALQAQVLHTVRPSMERSRYVVATTVAVTSSWALGMVASVWEPEGELASFEVGATVALFGAVLGALIGLAQWLVLRRDSTTRWWIPASMLGWTCGSLTTWALPSADLQSELIQIVAHCFANGVGGAIAGAITISSVMLTARR